MNQMSRATGSRDGRRIQYGFVCVPIAFSHLQDQSTHRSAVHSLQTVDSRQSISTCTRSDQARLGASAMRDLKMLQACA